MLGFFQKGRGLNKFHFADYWDKTSLLQDKKEIECFLKNFPREAYQITDVPGCGKFFLDNIDDGIKDLLRRGLKHDEAVLNAVKQYAQVGTTVLDVGAHIGTETIAMAHCVGSQGQVHAFEPQKKIFRELWANCQLNAVTGNVKIYRMAIGNSHELIQMAAPTPGNEGGTGFGSFDAELEMFRENWTQDQQNITVEGDTYAWDSKGDQAELRSIDSFHFDNVSLIKVDVEGNEQDVIDGMLETIKRNRPVLVIEILGWTEGLDAAQPHQKKVILKAQQKLVKLGYNVTQLSGHNYLALPKA